MKGAFRTIHRQDKSRTGSRELLILPEIVTIHPQLSQVSGPEQGRWKLPCQQVVLQVQPLQYDKLQCLCMWLKLAHAALNVVTVVLKILHGTAHDVQHMAETCHHRQTQSLHLATQ